MQRCEVKEEMQQQCCDVKEENTAAVLKSVDGLDGETASVEGLQLPAKNIFLLMSSVVQI